MNTPDRKYTGISWHGKGPYKALVATGRIGNNGYCRFLDHLDTGTLESGQKEFISHPYSSVDHIKATCQEDFEFLVSVGWTVTVSEDSEYNQDTIRISISKADPSTITRLLTECNARIEVLTEEVKGLKEKWMHSQDGGGQWLCKSAELDLLKVRKHLLSLKR